jgi:hypothetical protein
VYVNYFSKWPEAYAPPDQGTTTTAKKLVEEMFCQFGAPQDLHSDLGWYFEAKVLVIWTLVIQLATLAFNDQKDWDRHLPLVLWAYRSAVQVFTGCTPTVLMFD